MQHSDVLISICEIAWNNLEQLKTTASGKQLFKKLRLSITGQFWQLKGNSIFNHFIALGSFAIL